MSSQMCENHNKDRNRNAERLREKIEVPIGRC